MDIIFIHLERCLSKRRVQSYPVLTHSRAQRYWFAMVNFDIADAEGLCWYDVGHQICPIEIADCQARRDAHQFKLTP